jgi:uncharacterized protein (TIGR00369 family)
MSDEATAPHELGVLNGAFTRNVPHNAALGLELVAAGSQTASIRMPWAPEWVGDPERGAVHGGVITSLVDATCGAAVFLAVQPPRPIATLDLRIDHLRRSEPGRELYCDACCERVTTHIAFVRATVHEGDPQRPVATAAATFMVFQHGQGAPAKDPPR